MHRAALVAPLVVALAAGPAVAQVPADAASELTPVLAFRAFDRYTARGLPQSTVGRMVQDAEGALWLGTLDGLATFDGADFREVLPSPSTTLGAITALVRRRGGGLFVGSSAGLHVYDGRTWRFVTPPRTVTALAEDASGRLWLVDQRGRLFRSPGPPYAEWTAIDTGTLPAPLLAVTAGEDGTVWAASPAGVIRFGGGGDAAGRVIPFPSDRITVLMVDRAGTAWVGTQGGTVWRNAAGGGTWMAATPTPLPSQPVSALGEDWKGRIWAGYLDGHLAGGKPGDAWQLLFGRNGLRPTVGVTSILADREGTLWLGENGRGLQQWVGEAWRHRNVWYEGAQALSSGSVFGISGTASGGLLVAVFSYGLVWWDGHRVRQFGAADGLVDNVRCAVEPTPGVLWVGTRYGLYESRHGERFHQALMLPTGFIVGIRQGPDGRWFALSSTAGIFVRRDDRWVADQELNRALPDLNVRSMAWTGNGELWVATMRGVVAITPSGVEAPPIAHGDAPPAAHAVLEVADGEIWIGGGDGLHVRRGGVWRRMTMADGIPGRTIYALARGQGGAVWAAGSSGVGRYADGHWTRWDVRNGLLEEECNLGGLFVAPNGHVYAGTMAGLAHFDPSVEVTTPPPLRVFWRERPAPGPDGSATFREPITLLPLSWYAPWLTPTAVEYRSRVRPLSAEWSAPSTRRDLTLQNLEAGTWTVEVQARLEGTGERGWTEPIRTRIVVNPPISLRSVAGWSLAFLALIGVVAGAVRLRTRQLERKERALELAVAEAQANVKTLRGLIPICANCKKIRDDRGSWSQLEAYIRQNSEAEFSHGVCPDCFALLYPGYDPGAPDTPANPQA